MAILINGMKGLGDNIYQRAFIKKMGKVWIDTPWPEIYEDLPVKFVSTRTTLRTQNKNISKQPRDRFDRFPGGPMKSVSYGSMPIMKGLELKFKFQPAELDLPDYDESPVEGDYVVIRPVTLRREWQAETRNPLPEYIEQSAQILMEQGIKVVSVADLEDGEEWIVGNEPYSDVKFHKGELSVKQLLALIKNAKLVIGGIGWIVPACIAYKTPAWIVCGGNGAWNHPNQITSEQMDLSSIDFIFPDNYCMCASKAHNCDKKITGYRDKFRSYLASRDWDWVSSKGAD